MMVRLQYESKAVWQYDSKAVRRYDHYDGKTAV